MFPSMNAQVAGEGSDWLVLQGEFTLLDFSQSIQILLKYEDLIEFTYLPNGGLIY